MENIFYGMDIYIKNLKLLSVSNIKADQFCLCLGSDFFFIILLNYIEKINPFDNSTMRKKVSFYLTLSPRCWQLNSFINSEHTECPRIPYTLCFCTLICLYMGIFPGGQHYLSVFGKNRYMGPLWRGLYSTVRILLLIDL